MKPLVKFVRGDRLRRAILPTCSFLAVTFLLASPRAAEPVSTARLIKQLGSAEFHEREAAGQELVRRGESVLPELKRAIAESSELEIRHRASLLLEEINNRLCRPVRRCDVERRGSEIWCIRFSPDGSKAAAVGVWGTVWIWEVNTGNDIAALKHKESVH